METELGNSKELLDRLVGPIYKALTEFGYSGLEKDYVRKVIDENLAYSTAEKGNIISMMSRSMMEEAKIPLGTKDRPT